MNCWLLVAERWGWLMHIKTLVALICSVALLGCASAHAQLCDPQMSSLERRAAAINIVMFDLDSVFSRVEAVPPSEAEYLDREEKAALEQNSSPRFDLVFNRPYYNANKVQKSYKELRGSLEEAERSQDIIAQSISLSRALSEYTPLSDAMHAYIDFDNHRQPPIFLTTSDVWMRTTETLTGTRYQVLRVLQCALRQISGREPQKQ